MQKYIGHAYTSLSSTGTLGFIQISGGGNCHSNNNNNNNKTNYFKKNLLRGIIPYIFIITSHLRPQ